jgi:hypothetical protein
VAALRGTGNYGQSLNVDEFASTSPVGASFVDVYAASLLSSSREHRAPDAHYGSMGFHVVVAIGGASSF